MYNLTNVNIYHNFVPNFLGLLLIGINQIQIGAILLEEYE